MVFRQSDGQHMLCGGLQKTNLSVHDDLYFMPPASVPTVGSPTDLSAEGMKVGKPADKWT